MATARRVADTPLRTAHTLLRVDPAGVAEAEAAVATPAEVAAGREADAPAEQEIARERQLICIVGAGAIKGYEQVADACCGMVHVAGGVELASWPGCVIKEAVVTRGNTMKKTSSLFLFAFFLTGLFAVLPGRAGAQEDPPGRVARLNYIQGSVSYQVSGTQDWVKADPNRPLTTGDNLWADQNSRGEVHIASTAIRLSSMTGISFLTLEDRSVQLQLAQGTIEVHLRHLAAGDDFEIDTPNLAVTLTRAGQYVIQTDPGGASTIVVVRAGEAQGTGGGESYDLRPGEQYTFTGTEELTYDAQPAPGLDDFEEWCQSRDEREDSATAAHYVSRDVDGYYDLDEYGAWESNADYGMMWYPTTLVVGWAPYRFGHWVFIAPWGWTWVDDAPWGFAPFHYGRWCLVAGRWGWVPGPLVVRPVYAPALVGWVGGGGFSFAVSFGGGFAGVGWFPLGPRDVFIPAYRCSPRYVQNVNITNTRVVNITQVTNVYNTVVVNRQVTHVNYMYGNEANSVTAVSRETFVGARPVGAAAMHITSDQIARARVVESAPVAPVRTSYVSSTATVSRAKPPVPFSQRPAVVRQNPAVETRQRQMPETTFGTPSQPAGPRGGTTTPQAQPRPGFRPFTPPGGAATGQAPSGAAVQPAPSGGARPVAPQPSPQPQYQEQRSMRYTPPVKARDEMYDVHPSAGRPQPQPKPQPKQEEKRAEPSRQR